MKEERKPCLYGQSERAYYLNYFINVDVTLSYQG